MPARRLIVLVCLTGATTTVSVGAFPALLPELATGAALADWQLGAVVGAFGLARMLANVPAGLFITHHLRWAQADATSEANVEARPAGGGVLALLAAAAGAAIVVCYATVEQFVVPLRGSREFGLERAGIARLLMLSQLIDLATLLPLGAWPTGAVPRECWAASCWSSRCRRRSSVSARCP